MRFGTLLYLGVFLAGVAHPAEAEAKCGPRVPFVSEPDGAALPPNPVLYLFDGRGLPGPIIHVADEQGRSVGVRIEPAPSAPDLRTFAVRIATGTSREITLDLSYAPDDDFTRRRFAYRIDRAWKRSSSTPPAIASIAGVASSWTCSHQSTWNLTLSQRASAYRVEWSASEEDWRAGRRSRAVLPYHMSVFWYEAPWSRRERVWPASGELELGHVDCLGHTLIWPSRGILAPPLYVGVAALHADGTGTSTAAEPTALRPPPESWLPRGLAGPVRLARDVAAATAAVVLAFWLWRRRRAAGRTGVPRASSPA